MKDAENYMQLSLFLETAGAAHKLTFLVLLEINSVHKSLTHLYTPGLKIRNNIQVCKWVVLNK